MAQPDNTIEPETTEQQGIEEYSEFRARFAEFKEQCDFVPDVSSEAGYQKSKRVALNVAKVLTNLELRRKEVKADALAFGRKVDAEAAAIRESLTDLMLPHKTAYKELDRQEKERKAARKLKLEQRIETMAALPITLRQASSELIGDALERLEADDCEDFYEYTLQALKARDKALDSLGDLFSEKLQQEQDAIELADLQAKQAVRDQAEREENIKKEAAEKAKREAALEKKRNEQARAAAKELAKKATQEAERKAADAIAREKAQALAHKKELARIASEKKAAQAKAKKDRADAVAAEKARATKKAAAIKKAEEKSKADFAAAQLKREQDTAHRAKTNREAANEIAATSGVSLDVAKAIVRSIAAGHIPQVVIHY